MLGTLPPETCEMLECYPSPINVIILSHSNTYQFYQLNL